MASQLSILTRHTTLFKTLNYNSFRSISTFSFLSQEPQLATEPTHSDPPHSDANPTVTPLPPNPTVTPLPPNPTASFNFRTHTQPINANSVIPFGLLNHTPVSHFQSMAKTLDLNGMLNTFADWTTSQRWDDMITMFEVWIKSIDKNGRLNRPDVDLFNHYLRAHLMSNASVDYMLDLISRTDELGIFPNTASFNLVLKAMFQAKETNAAQQMLERMELAENKAQPDDESYSIVTDLLFETGQSDAALKYVHKMLKNGNMLPMHVFSLCARCCVKEGRLDTLVSIISQCKTMDQNKALCPLWGLCNDIADAAIQADNSQLLYYAFEFMARWITRGENARPPVLRSVDEGLLVSALGTATRTYNSILLDASWSILRRSLRDKASPSPESFIGRICAYASFGNLQRAFSTLHEFESAYKNSDKETQEELFSPFTSLNPLVVACSKKGFETLDTVYFQLENLSRAAEQPYKSVAALNCIILGCANIWDMDRAYQTFESIGSSFGLVPNIHSYNALMYGFGRLKKTFEAARVMEHMLSLGVKPNATSYSLLVDAHLINRDAKAALSIIHEMASAGFVPSKESLKKLRRRCIREMDYESDDRVESIVRQFNIRMGNETRRNILFSLDYKTDYVS